MTGLPDINTLIAYAIVLMISFSVHEFAHAWTANYFGDDTPRLNGRLTLNPLAHLDPIGSLMLLVAGFGWAKPVPVNFYALERRSPAAPMWVALAGPLSNFFMALLAAIPFRLGLIKVRYIAGSFFYSSSHLSSFQEQILLTFLATNLLLMVFNLLPIFPLDGEKIATYAFPPYMARVLDSIRPYGPWVLLALILMGNFAGVNLLGVLLRSTQDGALESIIRDMSLGRVIYRVRQFFLALRASFDPKGLEQARSILTPVQMVLFAGMHPSEQAHALNVVRQLVGQGETSPDLLVAALLHDVGKSCNPLRLWERVMIVLAKAIFPAQSRRWGNSSTEKVGQGVWKRAFVVAEQHPAWGAALAAEAGASPRAVALIRLHQESSPTQVDAEFERLLVKLQAVDDHA